MFTKEIINFLKVHNYGVELTMDQSPTLRKIEGESMHHSGGAASESVYIYQKALNFFYKKEGLLLDKTKLQSLFLEDDDFWQKGSLFSESVFKSKISILSLGFGLGYNEIITTLWAMINKIPVAQIDLVSYEKEKFLYQEFEYWLRDEKTILSSIYNHVLYHVLKCNHLEMALSEYSQQIKKQLLEWLEQGVWQRKGSLEKIEDLESSFNIIFYDAFSRKTTPSLWETHFLNQLMEQKTAKDCVLSTYACTGDLKRSFQQNNFYFIKRKGFLGKRNASLGFRFSIF